MQDAPAEPADAEVLALVRGQWAVDVDAVRYLPVGFGGHHWAASGGGPTGCS